MTISRATTMGRELLAIAILFIVFGQSIAKDKDEKPKPPPIMCIKCDSGNLPECAINPTDRLPNGNCSHWAEDCVVAIIEGVTYRGCSFSMNLPPEIQYIKTCNISLCNYGIYPPGRLKCHQCNGIDCVEEPKNATIPCLNFEEKDFCFTDVIDSSDVVRGCLSDNYETGPYTKLCNDNGCNNQPAISQLECLSCDSSSSGGCVKNPIEGKNCSIPSATKCKVDVLLGRPAETCFTYHKLGNVVRGCTKLSGKLQNDVDHFKTCEGDLCNYHCLNHSKCVVCDSDNNPNCTKSPESIEPKICWSDITCFSCREGNDFISRGCGTPKNIGDCFECQGDGCNTQDFKECYNCTSASDPNCAQWSSIEKIGLETCYDLTDKCIVAVDGSGHTVRGCQKDLDCLLQARCGTCNTTLCNKGLFPPDKLQCFQCRGNECEEDPILSKPQPCTKYDINDKCFAFADDDEMIRGCKSDPSYNQCRLSTRKCLECQEPGCNTWPIQHQSILKCIKCNDTSPSCSWTQKPELATRCNTQIQYDQSPNETCFSRFDSRSESIKRGCTLDEDVCVENDKDCELCETSGCNVAKFATYSCYQCSSNIKNEEACRTNLDAISPQVCKSDIQYYEELGCYIKMQDHIVTRGCVTDLNQEDLEECRKSDSNKCIYCNKRDCNNNILNNSPAFRNDLFLITAIILFVMRI